MLDSNYRIKGKILTPINGDPENPSASKGSKTVNKKSKKARDLTSASDTDGG
jgi:hypothetical protein